MASLELGVPNTTRTVFRVGSISKQFTAACIVMLALEGKLSLEDKLVKYVPDLPSKFYGAITIRQLLNHTSGIRDAEAMYPLMDIDYSQWYTDDMFKKMLKRQHGLSFPAGEGFEYSNSAFTLLAAVVDTLSGQPFEDFAADKIFKPLGMTQTHIQTGVRTMIPDRAAGYYKRSDGTFENWMTNNQLIGHDALYSSVEDLTRWVKALTGGVWQPGLFEAMTEPGVMKDGTVNQYASGLTVFKYRGLNLVAHNGWYVGYVGTLMMFHDEDFAVILLANQGNYGTQKTCMEIADILLVDRFAEIENNASYRKGLTDNRFNKGVPDSLTGRYLGIDLGMFITFESIGEQPGLRAGGNLYEPSPYAPNELINHHSNQRIIFPEKPVEDNRVIFRMKSAYVDYGRYIRFTELPVDMDELGRYTGIYRSDELGIDGIISEQEGKLVVTVGKESGTLSRFEKERFASGWAAFTFTTKRGSKINGFRMDCFGVQGIRFEKQ